MHIHRRMQIACTPAQLWRCLTEPELLKRWVTDLVDETPEDPSRTTGVGAVSTMQLREGKRIVAYRSVVTAWEPLRRVAIRFSGGSFGPGMEMDVAYGIAPEDNGGTVLDYDVHVPMKGFFFKLLSPLFQLMAASKTNKDLSALKALAPTIAAD
jgi:carbon monoxide dehydrogenase subunit G